MTTFSFHIEHQDYGDGNETFAIYQLAYNDGGLCTKDIVTSAPTRAEAEAIVQSMLDDLAAFYA